MQVRTPGMMTLSMSLIISCHVSGLVGAVFGINGLRYPGSTVGKTRLERGNDINTASVNYVCI